MQIIPSASRCHPGWQRCTGYLGAGMDIDQLLNPEDFEAPESLKNLPGRIYVDPESRHSLIGSAEQRRKDREYQRRRKAKQRQERLDRFVAEVNAALETGWVQIEDHEVKEAIKARFERVGIDPICSKAGVSREVGRRAIHPTGSINTDLGRSLGFHCIDQIYGKPNGGHGRWRVWFKRGAE